jgi:hypothetical protein
MLGAGDFAKLHRHREGLRRGLRLIGRKGLFFGFSLGADRGLKSETGSMLSRDMFDRSGARASGFRLRWRRTFKGENHLPDSDLLALFDFDFFDHAAHGRGDFDDRFVGFEFHHRLAFGNFRAGRNHEAHEIALRDVFTELGKLEFARGGRSHRRRCLRDRRWQLRGWFCMPGSIGARRTRGGRILTDDWREFSAASFSRSGFLRRSRIVLVGAVDGENHLPDFDFVPFFDANFLHRTAHRRRHFDDRLVGFQFHHGLAGTDAGARGDHQAHQVALLDVFSKFGKFEFDQSVFCASFGLKCLSA